MHDELVNRLREFADVINSANDNRNEDENIVTEAANAIEAMCEMVATAHGELANVIQSYEEEKPRWIPVTDRLPEEKTYVLILFDTIAGKMQGVCFLYKDDDGHNCWTWLDRLGKNLFDIQPTHWMPLPEPPKEGRT